MTAFLGTLLLILKIVGGAIGVGILLYIGDKFLQFAEVIVQSALGLLLLALVVGFVCSWLTEHGILP